MTVLECAISEFSLSRRFQREDPSGSWGCRIQDSTVGPVIHPITLLLVCRLLQMAKMYCVLLFGASVPPILQQTIGDFDPFGRLRAHLLIQRVHQTLGTYLIAVIRSERLVTHQPKGVHEGSWLVVRDDCDKVGELLAIPADHGNDVYLAAVVGRVELRCVHCDASFSYGRRSEGYVLRVGQRTCSLNCKVHQVSFGPVWPSWIGSSIGKWILDILGLLENFS